MRVGYFNKVIFLSLILVRVWQVNRYVAVGAIANYQLIPIRYGMRPIGIRYARVMFLQMPINITRAFGVLKHDFPPSASFTRYPKIVSGMSLNID